MHLWGMLPYNAHLGKGLVGGNMTVVKVSPEMVHVGRPTLQSIGGVGLLYSPRAHIGSYARA